jgi:hypothetical protein
VSYYSNRSERPHCYGDDSYFGETSASCRACAFSSDCENAINASINKVSIREAKTLVTPRKYTYSSSSGTTTTSSQKPPAAANALMRPVKFNHAKPLATQYMTYVGYDVAEAVAARAVDLVRSCRQEYEHELFAGEGSDADS